MLISLRIKPTAGRGQVILVVPVKTAKKAVTRNLLKRRARAIIRGAKMVPPTGRDYFFYFQPGSAKLSFTELKKEIYGLLFSSNILSTAL